MIGVEAWVLAVLSKGYWIPFHTTPPVTSHPVGFRSYPSGSVKAVALDREVQLLLKKGALEEASSTQGFYSHLFVVPKATGGFHPILELSPLTGMSTPPDSGWKR